MVDFGQDQSLCWYLLRKRFLFRDIKNFTLHTNVILTFGSRIFQSVSKIWSYLVSLLFNWVLDWSRILRDSLVSRQFKNLESRQTYLLLIQTIATLIVSFVVNSASYVSCHILYSILCLNWNFISLKGAKLRGNPRLTHAGTITGAFNYQQAHTKFLSIRCYMPA